MMQTRISLLKSLLALSQRKNSALIPAWRNALVLLVALWSCVAFAAEPSAPAGVKQAPSASMVQRGLAFPPKTTYSASSLTVVPLDTIFNPTTPLEGDYPGHDSKTYAGDWFWMDNHKIIFWGYEKRDTARDTITKDIVRLVGPERADQFQVENQLSDVTLIWDVDNDNVSRYSTGRVFCYEDGNINLWVRERPPGKGMLLTGPLRQEKEADTNARPRWYMHRTDCGVQPSTITKLYMEEHPEEYVKPLRKEDGFIVLGKHRHKDRGEALLQDFITFHPINAPPITLHMNNFFVRDDYFGFAKTYLFVVSNTLFARDNGSQRTKIFNYLLQRNGELREIKIPKKFSNTSWSGGIHLTRRGILWAYAVSDGESAIYLSHEEKVHQISHDRVTFGKVSPDGCRFAYMNVERNQYPLEGKLKVIDLCEGVR